MHYIIRIGYLTRVTEKERDGKVSIVLLNLAENRIHPTRQRKRYESN